MQVPDANSFIVGWTQQQAIVEKFKTCYTALKTLNACYELFPLLKRRIPDFYFSTIYAATSEIGIIILLKSFDDWNAIVMRFQWFYKYKIGGFYPPNLNGFIHRTCSENFCMRFLILLVNYDAGNPISVQVAHISQGNCSSTIAFKLFRWTIMAFVTIQI